MNKAIVFLLLVCVVSFNSCSTDCKNYTCKNFENTDLYDLAKAASNKDTVEFDEILLEKKYSLTTSMGKWNRTFISCLMYDDNYFMLEHVLRTKLVYINLNAIRPLILNECMSSEFERDNGLKYYEIFLSHGADPNLVVDGKGAYGNLLETKNFDHVSKIIDVLLQYGWDINNDELTELPLEGAVQNIRLVKYLIDKGADWHRPFKFKMYGTVEHIWDMSRHWLPPLNSENHRIKMELIKLFETEGYRYKDDSIPASTMEFIKREYPNEQERLNYLQNY
jgi:hypothetical protein